MNEQSYNAIRAILVDQFSWQVSGCNAVKWTENGEASFGLDGTVVVFYRYHSAGYPTANKTLGTVSVADAAEAAAEQVNAMVKNYMAEVAQ